MLKEHVYYKYSKNLNYMVSLNPHKEGAKNCLEIISHLARYVPQENIKGKFTAADDTRKSRELLTKLKSKFTGIAEGHITTGVVDIGVLAVQLKYEFEELRRAYCNKEAFYVRDVNSFLFGTGNEFDPRDIIASRTKFLFQIPAEDIDAQVLPNGDAVRDGKLFPCGEHNIFTDFSYLWSITWGAHKLIDSLHAQLEDKINTFGFDDPNQRFDLKKEEDVPPAAKVAQPEAENPKKTSGIITPDDPAWYAASRGAARR